MGVRGNTGVKNMGSHIIRNSNYRSKDVVLLTGVKDSISHKFRNSSDYNLGAYLFTGVK